MTKEEIMKLAEFEQDVTDKAYLDYNWPTNVTVTQKSIWREGARWQFLKLLPLIEALADSNEKLVEALESWLDFEAGCIKRDGPYTSPLIPEQMNKAHAALADHAERMKRIKVE